MKCNHCGHRHQLTSGGTGWSDPPGYFFFAGHALFVNAGVLAAFAQLNYGIHTPRGTFVFALGGVALVGGLLAFFISATVAMVDQYRYDSWPRCPKCEHEQVPRPWSI